MALVGVAPYGADLTVGLRKAFERCVNAWGSDPAYREPKVKIEQALREIELIEASPGQRAARSRPAPVASGQDRSGY